LPAGASTGTVLIPTVDDSDGGQVVEFVDGRQVATFSFDGPG
jgi:hypothetical protein